MTKKVTHIQDEELELDALLGDLRQMFPHGHPDFIPMMIDLMKLHSEKNYAYTHGGDPLGNFHRVSAWMKLYPDMDWATPIGVSLIYAQKQADASVWQLSQGYEDNIEGLDSRLRDKVVYGTLDRIFIKEPKEE